MIRDDTDNRGAFRTTYKETLGKKVSTQRKENYQSPYFALRTEAGWVSMVLSLRLDY
jgi:hypothetical protein